MTEIPVRNEELAVLLENVYDLGKLLQLMIAEILENPLRRHDIKFLVAEANRSLQDVGFHKVRRRLFYSYVNSVVIDIRREKPLERCRAAADIEKLALPPPR